MVAIHSIHLRHSGRQSNSLFNRSTTKQTFTQWPQSFNAFYGAALSAAAAQALWHGWLIRDRQREPCFKAFRLNHWLGFAVFVGVALSYAPISWRI